MSLSHGFLRVKEFDINILILGEHYYGLVKRRIVKFVMFESSAPWNYCIRNWYIVQKNRQIHDCYKSRRIITYGYGYPYIK